jgi:hypothetical protein
MRKKQKQLSQKLKWQHFYNYLKNIWVKFAFKSRIIFYYLFPLGLAHFEALELLSNQSSIILQTMSHGNEKLLEQVDNYFQIDDDNDLELNNPLDSLTTNDDNDNSHQIPTLDILSQKFTAHQTQLRSTVSVDKLLEVYESADQFLKEWDWMDTELDQKVKRSSLVFYLMIWFSI